ncbi:MAG TPA: pilus assembly protein TadG-related protein [Patescibacteria group bacterium]|nr:pilus assembly protein TadG-related protein [Patescibacteria group bacterium]
MSPAQADHRAQKGQAIVLIAIMLAVLVGMAALAIDGSRAYGLRRDLQAAVDSAALAGGDNLQQTGSYTSAEQAAVTIFGTNLRLYIAPACAPGYGAPGALPWTVTCTYSDGTTLREVVSSLGPQGTQFALTATRSLQLQFARILTNGATPTLGAAASSNVNNRLYSPTLAALSSAGCGGTPGNSLSVNGTGTLDIRGDVVSNGVIFVPSAPVQVAGDVYANCQAVLPPSMSPDCYPSDTPTPCTAPDVAGTVQTGYQFIDPNYAPPSVTGGSRPTPSNVAVLQPGSYAADPAFDDSQCWFLAGGVYQWTVGLTNKRDQLSNELKPPAEPSATDNTVKASTQFWNELGPSTKCAGDFQLTAVGASAIRTGSWAIELTSTRTDVYNGTSYLRESAPSYCQTVTIAAGQAIKIQVSNVPGATAYRVYAAPPGNGCAGPFGYAGSIAVVGSVLNDNLAGCPSYTAGACSLGFETATFDSTLLGLLFAPNAFAAPGTVGAYPPDGEAPPFGGRVVNDNAGRAAPPHGDRANENQCDTLAGAAAGCPAPITPGAVVFYLPSGSCLNLTQTADIFVFSGYQYDWMSLYEPGVGHPPANTCSNNYDSQSTSSFIGLFYAPAAGLKIPSKFATRTETTGGFIANTIAFTTNEPLIAGSKDYAPAPPASKLVS